MTREMNTLEPYEERRRVMDEIVKAMNREKQKGYQGSKWKTAGEKIKIEK